jgi:hypothetical protein
MRFWTASVAIFIQVGTTIGLQHVLQNALRWPATSNFVCLIIGVLLFPVSNYIFSSLKSGRNGNTQKSLYNFDHARLNVTLPPPTMWMNMGYWRVMPSPEARDKFNSD